MTSFHIYLPSLTLEPNIYIISLETGHKLRTTFKMTLSGIIAILLVTTTISSQFYVQKTSAQFTPMHGMGSCSAGKVRDWAGICFNKNEARACLTCAPGSATPTEKPEASAQVETKKGVEKPTTTEVEKTTTTNDNTPKLTTAEKQPKISSDQRSQLEQMERVLNSKSVTDKFIKENCMKLGPESEYGDCIRYGLAMQEWKVKYGENPTSPEAQKHHPWFKPTGSPPPVGFEKTKPRFTSLEDLSTHLAKQKQQRDANKWFDKEIEKHTTMEVKKSNSTTD
ncbi:MAG TPA: hypothetical protein VIY08_16360 [Candidatus Nitrosocosmicus sp.]